MSELFDDWPGKKAKDSAVEYPATRHMLDVAACAEALLKGHTAFAGLSASQRQALVILIALHDVGKFSERFRSLIRDGKPGKFRHWQLSDFLLLNSLDEVLEKGIGGNQFARSELYAAVAGHHGMPPVRNKRQDYEKEKAINSGAQVAMAWTSSLLKLFPGASLESISQRKAKALSWALSGLTVASDWIGSNTKWFPVEADDNIHDASEALAMSRQRAKIAVFEAGLIPPSLQKTSGSMLVGINTLRPLQETVENVELVDGPQLAILEDATGTGKTEAAIILAHRIMAMGKARGIYFALPTMATSNAMFDRINLIAPKLFETPPSTVLVHSKANLHKNFKKLSGTTEESTPEADIPAWLTDNRRQALLATVGIGTIDQALYGILQTNFLTLRLFGVSDKVLIVDEAHSYDPYMKKQLETLLKAQARMGGSAILMTATMPLSMRDAFAQAFQEGLEKEEPCNLPNKAYPALHIVNGHSVSHRPVKPLPEKVRSVRIHRLQDTTEAMNMLIKSVSSGAACIWIRNSVDEAIKAAIDLKQRLKEQGLPEERVDLLHARFALADRLSHEQEITSRFGKSGNGREGRILVATQVVEASLDLDFDVMVSDLAPIGSLIQRAGRLWRHMDIRPASKRCIPQATLHVLSPDPTVVSGNNWLKDTLGKGAWVYRLDHQWLTAKALLDANMIEEPGGLRELIEAVHGDNAPEIPEAIEKAHAKAQEKAKVEAGLAFANVIDVDKGYLNGIASSASDKFFPTRLGVPQITLVLYKRSSNGAEPWSSGEDKETTMAMSEVTASFSQFKKSVPDQDTKEICELKEAWPRWRADSCKACVVDQKSGMIGDFLEYSREYGLRKK